ncbi:MAG: hypothetical protein ACK5PR_01145 [bacterium]
MTRPDITFTITVNPIVYVYSCAERKAEEDRGSFGFHNSDRCPNCVTREAGYEFWGENGHMQGSANNRAGMVHWIGLKAKQQWRTKGHRLMGYRFITGGTLRYLGGYLAAASQPEETHK